MRELALFAGAGGGLLASRWLGWQTVAAVELEEFARSRLLARQRDFELDPFPIWDDICTFDGRPWRGHVDIVSGGFPCQPFSTASRGRVVATDLWPEMLRIITEVEPRRVFAENVSAYPIEVAAREAERLGFVVKCARVAASALGAPHRRTRFWLLATHPDDQGQRTEPLDEEMARLRRAAKLGWVAPSDTRVLGGHDGVAGRLDRMKAIGNGQCPWQAAYAYLHLENQLSRGKT